MNAVIFNLKTGKYLEEKCCKLGSLRVIIIVLSFLSSSSPCLAFFFFFQWLALITLHEGLSSLASWPPMFFKSGGTLADLSPTCIWTLLINSFLFFIGLFVQKKKKKKQGERVREREKKHGI